MTDLVTERLDGQVALVRINRPEKRNALSIPLRKELVRILQELDEDKAVRAIVLAGGDRVFASGADLTEIANASAVDMIHRAANQLWAAIDRLNTPLIAAVRGLALGGGFELAMHADMIVAGESAQFGLPEIRVGLMPGAGGTQRLQRLVGRHRALMIMLTGEPFSVDQAHAWGVVNSVAPDTAVDEHAIELARRVAAMPPIAVRQIREVVAAGADTPLSTALLLEHKALQLLCASSDKNEGIQAFLEKRKPVFTGN